MLYWMGIGIVAACGARILFGDWSVPSPKECLAIFLIGALTGPVLIPAALIVRFVFWITDDNDSWWDRPIGKKKRVSDEQDH